MARRTRTRIEGARELDRLLGQLPARTRGKTLFGALGGAALVLQKRLRLAAPVGETGVLKRSIGRQRVKGSRFSATVRVGPTTKAWYGFFTEFGTRFVTPRPWFRPAWDAVEGEMLATLGKRLGSRIEREARKLAGQAGKRRRRR